MKLVDMKLPKKTKKELKEEMTVATAGRDEGPEYPWGLQLSFEEKAIEKIPMLEKVKANAEVEIRAVAFVKEVSMTDSAKPERKRRRRVELQITKIGISSDQADQEDKEAAFEEGAKE
ncbi:MAG: capsid staple protein [Candidatus Paceibacterota bacterium]|jgi:hypothetical protein